MVSRVSFLVIAICAIQSAQASWFGSKKLIQKLEKDFEKEYPVDIGRTVDWMRNGRNTHGLVVENLGVETILRTLELIRQWSSGSMFSCKSTRTRYLPMPKGSIMMSTEVDIAMVRDLVQELNQKKSLYRTIADKVFKRLENCPDEYNHVLLPSKNLDTYVECVAETSDICREADKSDSMWKYKCMLDAEFNSSKFAPGVLKLLKSIEGDETVSKMMKEERGNARNTDLSVLIRKHLNVACGDFLRRSPSNILAAIEAIRWSSSIFGKMPEGMSEETLVKSEAIMRQCLRMPPYTGQLVSDILLLK